MATGYVRQDTSNNIANGKVIDAADLDAEFDALVAAFNKTSGHNHDGTDAGGSPIVNLGPAQDFLISSDNIRPRSDSAKDLGTDDLRFREVFTDKVTIGEGEITWNTQDNTLDMVLDGTGAVLQVGQEILVRIQNNTGSTLTNGTAVRYASAIGASGFFSAEKMVATVGAQANLLLGIVTEDIANGAVGFATAYGKVRGLNTSAFTEGATLWANPSIAGGLTATQPAVPNLSLPVGIVTTSHAVNGVIFVTMNSAGYGLVNDRMVRMTSLANNDLLKYNSSTGRFENSNSLDLTALNVGGSPVWTAANDGAGSGLDSDLLDGLQSTRFARVDATVDFTATQVLANNVFLRGRDTGAFSINLVGITGDNDLRVGSIYMPLNLSGTNILFDNGGTIQTVWHSGNDGAGSGLDADTVDGLQASSFARLDVGNTFTTTQTLANNIRLRVLSSGGTSYSGLYVGPDDVFRMCSEDLQTNIFGTSVNVVSGGSAYPVWHTGNDGPGSGMNADLLDGLEGSRFARADATVDFTATQVLANNIFLRGRNLASNSINLVGITDADVLQVGSATMPMNLFGTDLVFNNGANRTVWHSGNDGTGSGLDSDLLDGQQGSYYLTGTNISAATSSARGTIEIATSSETQTGTDATRAVTPDGLAASMLGSVDQAWGDYTGSRVLNTTYTNSTGRPIQLMITFDPTSEGATCSFSINGVALMTGPFDSRNYILNPIIPAGDTYSLGGAAHITKWAELR